jgi:hypothetical protein
LINHFFLWFETLLHNMASAAVAPAEATSSAAHRALFTYELLETILCHLCDKDIYSALQVCQFWEDVCNSSSYIAQAAFFEPLSPGNPAAADIETRRWSSLLVEDPYLGQFFGPDHMDGQTDMDVDQNLRPLVDTENAWWSDLLVHQPAIHELRLFTTIYRDRRRDSIRNQWWDTHCFPDGLRMGELCNLIVTEDHETRCAKFLSISFWRDMEESEQGLSSAVSGWVP